MDETNYDPSLYSDQDFFNEGDLAEPDLLLEGQRYVGRITSVDVSAAVPGAYRKFERALKDGRTAVPVIRLNVITLANANGTRFPDGANLRTQGSVDFWVGQTDTKSRHILLNLIKDVGKVTNEELLGVSIRDSAVHYLSGAIVSFTVRHRKATIQGIETDVQDFRGMKSATDSEKGMVIA